MFECGECIETSGEIIQILRDLNKNHHLTVIMVTHDLETAEIVSDQIIKMKDGKIVDQLTKTEVL